VRMTTAKMRRGDANLVPRGVRLPGSTEPGEGRLLGPSTLVRRDGLDWKVARRIDPQRGRRAVLESPSVGTPSSVVMVAASMKPLAMLRCVWHIMSHANGVGVSHDAGNYQWS